MVRFCRMFAVVLVFAFGFVALSTAQEDVVDKISIKAIKKIEVNKTDNSMLVTVVINNANEKGLQFRKGQFAFHMGAKDNKGIKDNDLPELELGKQVDHNSTETTVRNTKENGIIIPNDNSEVDFIIGMSADSFGVLAHIINCIGNPSEREPYIKISGEFELAMKSDKGWTSARDLKIDWIFKPSVPDKLNFMTGQ